jgi:hypothetical protein
MAYLAGRKAILIYLGIYHNLKAPHVRRADMRGQAPTQDRDLGVTILTGVKINGRLPQTKFTYPK